MPNDAKWDPADIRYNTIRWLNTVDGFCVGAVPGQPLSGEILNADIIVDASFVQRSNKYRTLVQQNQAQPQSLLSYMTGNSLGDSSSASSNVCTSGLLRQVDGNGQQKVLL
jgi:hypothetical protein